MFLSVSSYSWLPSSFFAKLREIQEHGIDGIEIFATPRHLDINNPEEVQQAGMMIRNMGFRFVTMHAPSSIGDLSNLDESYRDDAVLNCQRALDAAMLMGASVVTFHPSSIEGEMSQAKDRWISLFESLRDLSGYAEDRDVKIAIENFPKPLFGSDPVELYEQLVDLNLPNVGMCLDIGHAFVGGYLPSSIPRFGEKIFTVHASDNRGHVDEHLPPGQGNIDWNSIITALRRIDYKGPFVIEVRDGRRIEHILEDIIDFADRSGLSGVGQLSH